MIVQLLAIYAALCAGWLIGWLSCVVLTRRLR